MTPQGNSSVGCVVCNEPCDGEICQQCAQLFERTDLE